MYWTLNSEEVKRLREDQSGQTAERESGWKRMKLG